MAEKMTFDAVFAKVKEVVAEVFGVEEDQLSLAIGRRGQNVRLAAMLSGYKVNIISKSKLNEKITLSVNNLLQIDGLTEPYAQVLVQHGVMNVGDLSGLEVSELQEILEVSEEEAQQVVTNTLEAIDKGEIKLAAEEEEELVSASAIPAYKGILEKESEESGEPGEDKFSEAERRLREELAAFKLK